MQSTVDKFLKDTGMHYSTIDLDKSLKEFVEEMNRGLSGDKSSLMMLPTYIKTAGKVPLGEEIIVMDAGGTNFRVATVTFTENGTEIKDFQKFPMPGTTGALERDEFFDALTDKLLPVIDRSEKVGFCFSYPTDIQPNRDGRLIRFSKEMQANGVEGELIGEGINQSLKRRGLAPKSFILLNDTVATMLGGIAVTRDYSYDGHIGYILGTGTNTCYLEQSAKITKAPAAVEQGGQMIVNAESGGYGLFAQGEVDKELDATTSDPGMQKLEKMVSGAYQGTVIYRTVKKAAEQGLFSDSFINRLSDIKSFTMFDIDQFCFFPYGDNVLATLAKDSESDAITLYDIIDASFERAARITAINLAAIAVQTGTGKSPLRPICVTAEGTTFYKSKLFRGKLDYYVRSWVNDKLDIYMEFTGAENATLIGTAVAGLLN